MTKRSDAKRDDSQHLEALLAQEIADMLSQESDPIRAARSLLDMLGGGGVQDQFSRSPVLLARKPQRHAYIVRVDLKDVKPPIWRRLRVSSEMSLASLHPVLQAAMGWSDYHLHQFVMGPGARDWQTDPFLTDFAASEGETGVHESDVRLDEVLAEPGDRLHYDYDFGDGWHHTIKLESIEEWQEQYPQAWCLAGRRACPPEDVGGPWSYAEVVAALDGDINPQFADEMADKLDWLPTGFDPAHFDVAEVNEMLDVPDLADLLDGWTEEIGVLLSQLFGPTVRVAERLVVAALREPFVLDEDEMAAAVHRYQVLLNVVGDGVKLTKAGWLPPAIVQQLVAELAMSSEWIGMMNREEKTVPVAELRASAVDLGLLRKAKGALTVPAKIKKIQDSPADLLAHIAARMPIGRGAERDAGILTLLAAAAGRSWQRLDPDEQQLFWSMGWQAVDGPPEWALHYAAAPTVNALRQLAGGRTHELSPQLARFLLRHDED